MKNYHLYRIFCTFIKDILDLKSKNNLINIHFHIGLSIAEYIVIYYFYLIQLISHFFIYKESASELIRKKCDSY